MWNKRFLIGLSDGSVEEIEIPLNFDNSKTFLMQEYSYKKFFVKLAENQIEKDEEKSKRKKKEDKKKKEPQPSAVISVKYINTEFKNSSCSTKTMLYEVDSTCI